MRRQRHILGRDASLLATHRFLGDARGAAVGAFVIVLVLAMCADFLVASWREAPMLLGPLELLGVGGAAAMGAVALRAVTQRSLTAAGDEPRQLAAAVEKELDVAAERRAEVERLEIAAMRAFWLVAGDARRLLLDCAHDGWVVITPPEADGDVPVHQRWTIERLRWTHAILSLTSHGQPLPARNLRVEARAFEGLDACDVRGRSELPVEIQGVLPDAAHGYR